MINSMYQPYSADIPLMLELGLKMWSGRPDAGVSDIALGVVRPYEDQQAPGQQTEIAVFVAPMPAQFWRFEILRHADRENYSGMESITITTGSGLLRHFWPMALSVANNMLNVSTVKPSEIIEAEQPSLKLGGIGMSSKARY